MTVTTAVYRPSYQIVTEVHTLDEMDKMEGDGTGIIVTTFRGISTLHHVMLRYDDMAYVRFMSFDGGSYEGLKKAAKKEQPLTVYIPTHPPQDRNGRYGADDREIESQASMMAWRAAANECMATAMKEVDDEQM